MRRIPVPIYKKADPSYTTHVQIGMPAQMTSTSADDGLDHYDDDSSEENKNHNDGYGYGFKKE